MDSFINQEITQFIPQREPFILVDKLRSCVPEETNSIFEVKENHLLVDGQYLLAGGLVENMAQTAAAGTGYLNLMAGEEVKRGYIGAIKNLKVYALPMVRTTLYTRSYSINKVLNVTIIKAEVRNEENFLYAECEMKIFLEE